MNVTSSIRDITADTVVSGAAITDQPRLSDLTDSVANLVIETFDEFDGSVYTTSTGADYLNGSPSHAAFN